MSKTVFDLHPNVIYDEQELGLRVACAMYSENETSADNFCRVLYHKHRIGRIGQYEGA